jgi:hypothetical protein
VLRAWRRVAPGLHVARFDVHVTHVAMIVSCLYITCLYVTNTQVGPVLDVGADTYVIVS